MNELKKWIETELERLEVSLMKIKLDDTNVGVSWRIGKLSAYATILLKIYDMDKNYESENKSSITPKCCICKWIVFNCSGIHECGAQAYEPLKEVFLNDNCKILFKISPKKEKLFNGEKNE